MKPSITIPNNPTEWVRPPISPWYTNLSCPVTPLVTHNSRHLSGRIFVPENPQSISGLTSFRSSVIATSVTRMIFEDPLTGNCQFQKEDGQYQGKMKDGLRHGNGHFLFHDDTYYNGEWCNDKRHGKGVQEDENGRYDGHWENDMRHGQGTYTDQTGKVTGTWINDVFQMPNHT